jgi:hypothetical protein
VRQRGGGASENWMGKEEEEEEEEEGGGISFSRSAVPRTYPPTQRLLLLPKKSA